MTTSLIDYYLLVFVFIIALILLRRDTQRYATSEHITQIDNNDEDKRVYVASRITDKENPGAKILLVMYSIYCRKCKSTNIFVDMSDEDESIHITCRDCGYITRIELEKLFVKKKEE